MNASPICIPDVIFLEQTVFSQTQPDLYKSRDRSYLEENIDLLGSSAQTFFTPVRSGFYGLRYQCKNIRQQNLSLSQAERY